MPQTLVRLWFALLFSSTIFHASLYADESRRLTPEGLWGLGRVSEPRLSPDGQSILYEVTTTNLPQDTNNSDIYLIACTGGEPRRLTTHEKADFNARWSPDGKKVGFISTRAGKPQVFLIDPQGGEPIQLTAVPEGVGNFSFSPRGDRIAFTSKVRLDKTLEQIYPDLPKANAKIIDSLLYRHWNDWYDGTYEHLMVLGISGQGQPLDLMEGKRVHTPLVPFGGPGEIAWSPDGVELCYTAKDVKNPESSTNSDLYIVPVTGGPAVNITDGMKGFDRNPLYSPNGKYIAFNSMARAGFEADRERVMLYDRSTKSIRELSTEFDHWVEGMAWLPDSSGLIVSVPISGCRQLFRMNLDGSIMQLTKGQADLVDPVVSPDGKTIYVRHSTMIEPHEIAALAIAGGEPRKLTATNTAKLAKWELPKVEERYVPATDGKKVHCWVVYPPGFDPKKKYPMLTYCQGGPQSPITQNFSFRWNFHLMASQGYVVLCVNRRGLPGFGQAWNDAISRDYGGQAMSDYTSATDELFKEPYIDRKRTAVVGASFGGYSVYWLLGHDKEDRFCAAISHCGVFNLESFYGTTEELWFPNFDLGGPYWEGSPDYQKFSPHRFVGNWDTPVLVIHGEKDFRVTIGEGMQAFTAAKLRGVPAKFLYFPDEGHWVMKPQNSVLWNRVFFEWLDQYCQPGK